MKVTFLEGAQLDPMPPETSKHEKVRYLNIYEDETFDEAQFTDWVVQASKLDGERIVAFRDFQRHPGEYGPPEVLFSFGPVPDME